MTTPYWHERIKAEQMARIERDATLSEEMERLYHYHFKSIEKEIRAFEQRYADKNRIPLSEVKARLDDMDVVAFSEKAKRYVKEKDFSDKANRELSLYNLKMKINRLELLQYQMDLELIALAEDERKLTERFLNKEYTDELKQQAGLLGRTVLSKEEVGLVAQTLINTPFKGAVWSERIWSRLQDLRQIVAEMAEEYLLRGKNPTGMIPKLRKEFDVSVFEARRLAITEGARVATEMQRLSFEKSGYEEYEFIAEPKACQICAPLNGKIFKVSDMIPGDNASPMHPFCRCSTAAHYSRNRDVLDNTVNKEYNQDMKSGGAIYGAWNSKNDPDEVNRRAHAEKYYESVRSRDTNNEINRVSKNTNFSRQDVEEVYYHVFENLYELEGGLKRFDPDYDMAESWRRLFDGKDIQKHDLTLLNHELMESKLMKKGMNYDSAHNLTQKKYDYLSDLVKWQIERGDY